MCVHIINNNWTKCLKELRKKKMRPRVTEERERDQGSLKVASCLFFGLENSSKSLNLQPPRSHESHSFRGFSPLTSCFSKFIEFHDLGERCRGSLDL